MAEKHSAEWLRGSVAVLGRMVDECSTVFDSDLPHITQGNLEDYLAEYAEELHVAEASKARKHSWVIGSLMKYPVCTVCGIVQRRDGKNSPCKGPTKIEARKPQPDAAAVIEACEKFLTYLMKDLPPKLDPRMRYREFQFDDSDVTALGDLVAQIAAWKEDNRG